MAELLAFSQSSLFLVPKYRLRSPSASYISLPSSAFSHTSGTKSMLSPTFCLQKRLASCGIRAAAVSDSKTPTTVAADSAGGNNADLLPKTGGGDSGGADGNKGGLGGGGGGDNGKNNSGDDDNSGESGKAKHQFGDKDEIEIRMSQKYTLAYAVLVGARGVIDYKKSGNRNSLMNDVESTVLLLLAHMLLPAQPMIASLFGFAVATPQFQVMATLFMNSGKFYPDGVLLCFHFFMAGCYFDDFIASHWN